MDRDSVKWQGFIPAVTTPFNRNGSLDEKGWCDLMDLMGAQGMHGICVCGTSGEWSSMTFAERRRVFELAVKRLDGRMPLIAGISAFTPGEVIALGKAAKAVGMDGLMFTVPPYVVPSPKETVVFYRTVSDAVELPIIVYNWCRGTGVEIDPALSLQLAEIPKVVAIKYATANRALLYEALLAVKEKIRVFGSFVNPVGLACLMQIGGDGFLAGGALLGSEGPAYFEAVWRGDVEKARPIAAKNAALTGALFYPDYAGRFGAPPAIIKAAMNLMGQPGGYPRPPYLPLEEQEIGQVREILKRFGML